MITLLLFIKSTPTEDYRDTQSASDKVIFNIND